MAASRVWWGQQEDRSRPGGAHGRSQKPKPWHPVRPFPAKDIPPDLFYPIFFPSPALSAASRGLPETQHFVSWGASGQETLTSRVRPHTADPEGSDTRTLQNNSIPAALLSDFFFFFVDVCFRTRRVQLTAFGGVPWEYVFDGGVFFFSPVIFVPRLFCARLTSALLNSRGLSLGG